VKADEVTVHEADRHHMCVVHDHFRKGIREPRHPALAHADIQILVHHIACRGVLRVGIAFDTVLNRARANSRATTFLAI